MPQISRNLFANLTSAGATLILTATLLVCAAPARAQQPASRRSLSPRRGDDAPTEAVTSEAPRIVVTGAEVATPHPHDDFRPKLDHIMREVSGAEITVTKKATAIKLDLQPQIINNNQQDVFNRAPGVFISEQNTPSQFNISYRGLGNPQESEYVTVLQDRVPLMSDWIGFPTLYYLPLPQSISEIQVIRGGSSLLYGPEPAPAINYVSRRPVPGSPFTISTEQIGGGNGLYSTYNFTEGTAGPLAYRADFGYLHSDGQRTNSESNLYTGSLFVGYQPAEKHLLYLDFKGYSVSAGSPGRLPSKALFDQDESQSLTPYNHEWVDRYNISLGYDGELTENLLLQTKLYYTTLELDSRTAGNNNLVTGQPPATTQLQNEDFENFGADVRTRLKWGRGSALTAGGVYYHSNAPFEQFTIGNPAGLSVDRDDRSGVPRLDQERHSDYEAVFIENVFRFGKFHIVPSFRLDHETVAVREVISPFRPRPGRPLADLSVNRTVPLWGIGFGNDFGKANETYFNASSGWRPLRYFDVVSPFSATFVPGQPSDPFTSLDFEAGVHGTPLKGFWYDVGLFWMEFDNRTETQFVNPGVNNDTILANSGSSRHRGFEGEASYDLFAPFDNPTLAGSHLIVAANLQLLDAEFTKSTQVANGRSFVGNTPAFAPAVLAKFSLTYRVDRRCNISLSGIYVSSQYWQDSNLPSANDLIPAKVPSYVVVNLTGQYDITKNVRILAGITNLGDEKVL